MKIFCHGSSNERNIGRVVSFENNLFIRQEHFKYNKSISFTQDKVSIQHIGMITKHPFAKYEKMQQKLRSSNILESQVYIIQITWNIELLIQQTFFDHKFSLAPTFDLKYIISPPVSSFQKFLASRID